MKLGGYVRGYHKMSEDITGYLRISDTGHGTENY